ncbi:MAG TPA: metallophosphoesterase [Gemmatimonadales bacterium]|nr:metallophosphoesterase [Gemmatimonadales bacterium]
MRKRLAVVMSVWILLHIYVGVRLLSGAGLGGVGLALAWLGVVALGLAPLAAFAALSAERKLAGTVLYWGGFTAMGLSSILIVLVLAADLLWVRGWVAARVVSMALVVSAVALTALGTWRARRPRIVRVVVPIVGLPPALAGFRIAQISDLHVGATIKRPFVDAVVDAVNALDPDLIAFTGDVADGRVAALAMEVAPLARLRAPEGKFFVSGNHEYYWDAPGWLRELERLGFTVLTNAHRVIARGSARLLVAGVTDRSTGHLVRGHASNPATAVAGAPPSDVKVLLAHQPRSAFAAREVGFDLQLSGHTHGGQYFPFNVLVRLFQPFAHGLHRVGAMWLYVSRGTGYWGPPLRLGAPAEITVIELQPAADAEAASSPQVLNEVTAPA